MAAIRRRETHSEDATHDRDCRATEGRLASAPLIGLTEFVERTGLSEGAIRHHLERGDWPGLRLGRRGVWRMPRAVLAAVLAGVDPTTLKPRPPDV